MSKNKSDLVTSTHLARKALIYVRQSTPQQVINNQESLRLQYGLKERALSLGWQSNKIRIIDADLGISGSASINRQGFKEVLAEVTLGQVGIILSSDVTRLTRNCTDWYPLLDICAYRGCLIGDRDGVYDPSSSNGRLLLGLKGQISELELSTIRARMTAGLLSKASRGELKIGFPTGYVRNGDGQIIKIPDREVRNRIHLIFEKFLELRSAEQVMKYLKKHKIKIPRLTHEKEIIWKIPTSTAIRGFLKNPAYAGTYVFGKKQVVPTGPSTKASRVVKPQNWRFCIHDKYPAYIDRNTHEKIQKILADNHAEYTWKKSRGMPRGGMSLLQGIAYCGACNHKMIMGYKNSVTYTCRYDRKINGMGPTCQRIPTHQVDSHIVQAFFQTISTIELDVLGLLIESRRKSFKVLEEAQKDQLERYRYQESLAKRQYNRVDPDNRLVAAELESLWEQSLAEFTQAQREYDDLIASNTGSAEGDITSELREEFKKIGTLLPEIWQKNLITYDQKKLLLRSIIEKVSLRRLNRDKVEAQIAWKGGEVSTLEIPITVGALADLSNIKILEEKILKLAKQGVFDHEIAQKLELEGYRSPMNRERLLRSTVTGIRLKHRLIQPQNFKKKRKFKGYFTIPQLASQLNVYDHWIRDRIYNGTISIKINKECDQYRRSSAAHTFSNEIME